MVGKERYEHYKQENNQFKEIKNNLSELKLIGKYWAPALEGIESDARDNVKISGWKLLSYPGMLIDNLLPHMSKFLNKIPSSFDNISARLRNKIDVESDYEPFRTRERRNIEKFEDYDKFVLPQNFNYTNSGNLKISHEVCSILNVVQPSTLGQAMKLRGVTPTAIMELRKIAKMEQP